MGALGCEPQADFDQADSGRSHGAGLLMLVHFTRGAVQINPLRFPGHERSANVLSWGKHDLLSYTGDPIETTLKPSAPKVRFGTGDEFHKTLKRKVDRYFGITGRSPRDCPGLYV
jgi:hypothetical protein